MSAEWIKVSDGLPSAKYGDYLCVTVGNPWGSSTWEPRIELLMYQGKGEWSDWESIARTVSHWRDLPPLPEPT